MDSTIIQKIDCKYNNIYIKRDDLLPYSFGGNKARKARLFFAEIEEKQSDCVVTYGSSSSNHCRIIANMAKAKNIECYIVSPEEESKETFNSKMMQVFGAKIIMCPVNNVSQTIENLLQDLRFKGKNPYFIQGGGHGNLGTQAYVDCYEEIKSFEKKEGVMFDYIFHASGTGTTQAGLVCGQLLNGDERQIIGISIARRNPRGRNVIVESIREYLQETKVDVSFKDIEAKTILLDSYIGEGYGKNNIDIVNTIKEVMLLYGIPLDCTYTGKAFYGMNQYLKKEDIRGKNILFIHTGGTPLFFDDLKNF